MKILTTLLLTAVSTVMLAQIPNADFENWTSGNPTGWSTLNSIEAGSVTQSSTHYTGASSVSLNSLNFFGSYVGGIAGTNNILGDEFFVNAGNPAALNGWYQLTVSGGDEFQIDVLTKNTSDNGAGTITYTTNTGAVWKQFSDCINYSSGTADSAAIVMSLTNSGATHSGSMVLVDDLSFGTCTPTGVAEISNNNVSIEAAYPNPANTSCNIIFSLPGSSTVSIALYDLSGRKVLTALGNTVLSDGRYKVPVDVTKLTNGVYVYTISVDGVPYTQKLVVAK